MALIINQISYERNNHILFDNINTTLYPGECLQVQGANGSGKSTLLRILASLLEPLSGQVLWNKQCIFKHSNYQQQLHYIGHQNGVKRFLTVFENIQLYSVLSNIKQSTQKIHAVIKQVGLTSFTDTKVQLLSAGQARRLSLAKILINPTVLWILDEPYTALDMAGQQLFLDILQQHLKSGRMAIIATHQALIKNAKLIQL